MTSITFRGWLVASDEGGPTVRFGVHYLTTYLPELDGTAQDFYRHLFEQIQTAEELGFADAWVTEHHFHEFGGLIPNPPVFLAALAQATSRIHLGVAISVLPLNNPLQNAEAYAMVDLLSDGRLELGVGRGANPEEYEDYRIGYEDSPLRLREHAEVLRQAWSDEPVSFHGQLYEYENVRVLPKPVQRPHPPIWVGASRSDDTFRWAGENGFNLMTLPYTYEPSVLLHWYGVYQDALREHGHDPARREVLGKFHVYVGENDSRARTEAGPFWLNYQRLHFTRGAWTLSHQQTVEDYAAEVERGHIIAGDPARCIDLIERYREAYPLTTFSGQFHYGGMPQDMALRSLRLFAEQVMPALKPAGVA